MTKALKRSNHLANLFDEADSRRNVIKLESARKKKSGGIQANPNAPTYVSAYAHEYTSMERLATQNGYHHSEVYKFILSTGLLISGSIGLVTAAALTYVPPSAFLGQ